MSGPSYWKKVVSGPYRLFFPLGVLLLLCGILIWLPLLWNPGEYPVLLHRTLVLNGFVASFIGGFLMTAVPKFSKTNEANCFEVLFFLSIVFLGVVAAHLENEIVVNFASGLEAICLLTFMFRRIKRRKENPPYSFIFIFVGLILWAISSFTSIFVDSESIKSLHYEGAIAAIILGVGSRLIPGILGHVEIVSSQRKHYETPKNLISTIPKGFAFIVFCYVISYFLMDRWGSALRAVIVSFIALKYWRVHLAPQTRTALTWCIWISAWMIALSFLLKAVWSEGSIHASHSFFINGIVLMSLLIATRVLQSHGPNDRNLENLKVLYAVTFLVVLAAVTRVTAFLMPEAYLRHLGYSSLVLALAVILWGQRYLRYINTAPAPIGHKQ